jgi:hypothetical protein
LATAGHAVSSGRTTARIRRIRFSKPDNVVVGRDGRVRVLDFGLARHAAGEPSPDAPALAGTPAYMAPEQCEGGPGDARSDQFAFCVTAWECLFGEHPFAGATAAQTMDAIVHGRRRPPPRERGRARALARTLARGLSVRPDERFPSLDALLAELQRDPWRPLKRAAQALFGAAAIAGIADTVYLLTRPGEVAVFVTADGRPLAPARVTVGPHALAVSPTGAEGHVPAGTHVLRVAAPDHLPRETVVEVERGGRVQLELELQRATGTFELEVEPPGSTVLVDGVDYGSRLRRVAVPTGAHELLVRRAGHHDVRLRWTAERDALREGFVALPPAQT